MLHQGIRRSISFIITLTALAATAPISLAEEEIPVITYTFGRELCEECRSYRLKLFPSGQVVYEGTVLYYELPPSASKSVRRETRATSVSEQNITTWVNVLAREDFFSLLPRYRGDQCAADGRSEQTMTLFANGKSKTVSWVGCAESEAPLWLREIATEMKKQVNPDQWLKVIPNPYLKMPEVKSK